MITGTETAHLIARSAPVIPENRLPVVEAKVAADLNLRDGQVVQATLQTSLQALKFNEWDLRLPLTAAQAGVMARWTAPDSETLKLRVQLMPNGSILLRPLPPAAQATTSAQMNSPQEAAGLSASRLHQLAMRPTDLRALTDLLKPGVLESLIQTGLSLDSDARLRLQTSLRLRPGVGNLSADKIKNWVKHSGLGTEHHLLNSRQVSPADFKLGLRALLAELSADDADSTQQLHQALDDLEASQLLGAQTLTGREWTLSLVLPFRDANPVLIRFSRAQPQPDQPNPALTIQLHTQLGAAGDIWMHTRIHELQQVDMVMWATNGQLAHQARIQSQVLTQELEGLGLRMTSLQVIHGRRPEEVAVPAPNDNEALGHLLDLRT